MMELLVPANSPEAVTAAVQSGADAVYLSFQELNDCRRAENISDDGFEASVRYCRVRGCKVYLAMNIPIQPQELQRAAGLALRAQRAGVDAILLRDLGLFSILRKLTPELPLFADHRLGFYTPESAAIAAGLGFQRIFLPPELPLEDICRIASASTVETAVFVQRSLCAAVAGCCRMSALNGRGSEDRGLCECPCRESYTLGGRWDSTPLSWKDRSLLPCLRELEAAGVSCACLGDRDRRAEYAAAYTGVFGPAIRDDQHPAPAELERLESLFSPWGVAREEIFEPAEERRPETRALERACAELRRGWTETEARRVDVSFAVVARREGEPIYLGVQARDKTRAVMEGPAPTPLGDVELTEKVLTEAMYRTAGTPFRCLEVDVVTQDGLRVSGVELDAARRRLLYKLSETRAQPPAREEGAFPSEPLSKPQPELPVVNFSFQTAEQMTPELAELRPGCVYAPLELLAERPELAAPFRERECEVAAILPAAVRGREEEEELRALLAKVREQGVARALTGNLGLAVLAGQEGLQLRGDMELYAANAYSLQSLAAAGFVSVCLPPELTLRQIHYLSKPVDTELTVYGRIPAMVTETCLLKASAGRCICSTPGQLADRQGGVWPVTRHFGCRNTVWAAKKLWLRDVTEDWLHSGLWAVRLSFSTESPRECLEVARSFILGEDYRPNGMTRGLYYRGVQ